MSRPKLLKKVFVGLGIFIATISTLIFLALYFLPELAILYFRHSYHEHDFPTLYMTPEIRVLDDNMQPNEETDSHNGLVFQTPWGSSIDRKEIDEVETCRFWFPGNREILVIPDGTIAVGFYRDLYEGEQTYKGYIGNGPSIYGLLEPILNTTPNNIRFFQSREKMGIEIIRLGIKVNVVPICSKIYYLKTPHVDVIEFYLGDEKPLQYLLEISDEIGNFYSITVFGPRITQSEIEQLVASMRIVVEP